MKGAGSLRVPGRTAQHPEEALRGITDPRISSCKIANPTSADSDDDDEDDDNNNDKGRRAAATERCYGARDPHSSSSLRMLPVPAVLPPLFAPRRDARRAPYDFSKKRGSRQGLPTWYSRDAEPCWNDVCPKHKICVAELCPKPRFVWHYVVIPESCGTMS
eukprot:gene13724-biopygen6976